jgi:hypothetical protein
MSPEQIISEHRYTDRKPFVRAIVAIINEQTAQQITIQKDLWIDSGFDGGIHVAQSHKSDITMIGVNPRPGPIGLAGGRSSSADRCFAYLQRIGNHEFPMPGIEVELILHGSSSYGLIGLDALKQWIIELNGPNEFFKIRQPQETSESGR